MLTSHELRDWRLHSLLLAQPPTDRTVGDIVRWHGAMQAQEWGSGLWSLGARKAGSTLTELSAELEDRSIVRTWPTRGTLQWVPSEDARWMVTMLGNRALAGAARRREQLGMDDATAYRAVDLLGEALAGGNRLTRSSCIEMLSDAGIDMSSQRSYHLIWFASQLGVSAIAPHVGKDQTLVLLDDWVEEHRDLDEDQALATIAQRYVQSHGPVSDRELARWASLSLTEARAGLAAADLFTVDSAEGLLWVATPEPPPAPTQTTWALPAFDEYLLGYGQREVFLRPQFAAAVVPGNNGIFKATVVVDGEVVGWWKRTLRAKDCAIAVTDLAGLGARDRAAVESALEPYGTFVERPLTVTWTDASG